MSFNSELFSNPARVLRRRQAVERALTAWGAPFERWCVMVRDGAAALETKVGRREEVLDMLHRLAASKSSAYEAANVLQLIARIDALSRRIPVMVIDADDASNDTVALEPFEPRPVQ